MQAQDNPSPAPLRQLIAALTPLVGPLPPPTSKTPIDLPKSLEIAPRLTASTNILSQPWQSFRRAQAQVSSGPVDIDPSASLNPDTGYTTADIAAQAEWIDRIVGLLPPIQECLVRELGPVESRAGLNIPDYTLGSTDLRVTRRAIALIIAHLDHLGASYVSSLGGSDPARGKINAMDVTSYTHILSTLFTLLQPVRIPYPPSPSSTGNSPSSSTPTRSSQPPLSILSTPLTHLIAPHLPSILLHSILLSYTPSLPAPTHAQLRKNTLLTLSGLAPAICISGLSGSISLAKSGLTPLPLASPPSTPSRIPIPTYVSSTSSRLLSSQILRPGGVRGLMTNLLPTDEAGPITGDAQRTAHVVGLLERLPAGVDRAIYTRHVYAELLVILAPPRTTLSEGSQQQQRAPRSWRVAAAQVAVRLWQVSGSVGKEVWAEVTRPVWIDTRDTVDEDSTNSGNGNDQAKYQRDATLYDTLGFIQGILQNAEPTTAFMKEAVSPLVPALLRIITLSDSSATDVSPSAQLSASSITEPLADLSTSAQSRIDSSSGNSDANATLAQAVILLWTDLTSIPSGVKTLSNAILSLLAASSKAKTDASTERDNAVRRLIQAIDREGFVNSLRGEMSGKSSQGGEDEQGSVWDILGLGLGEKGIRRVDSTGTRAHAEHGTGTESSVRAIASHGKRPPDMKTDTEICRLIAIVQSTTVDPPTRAEAISNLADMITRMDSTNERSLTSSTLPPTRSPIPSPTPTSAPVITSTATSSSSNPATRLTPLTRAIDAIVLAVQDTDEFISSRAVAACVALVRGSDRRGVRAVGSSPSETETQNENVKRDEDEKNSSIREGNGNVAGMVIDHLITAYDEAIGTVHSSSSGSTALGGEHKGKEHGAEGGPDQAIGRVIRLSNVLHGVLDVVSTFDIVKHVPDETLDLLADTLVDPFNRLRIAISRLNGDGTGSRSRIPTISATGSAVPVPPAEQGQTQHHQQLNDERLIRQSGDDLLARLQALEL